ncbi:MerR family DNA-binding protein [Rubellimicrobium sp. CFH 75288]|nr:MerR family DNA-binding protein [Rubellimicrobium sp. CFH 75288]
MIRHYEALGLLPPAPRRPSGYREYDEADLHRLRFIRRARDLGFTLDGIADLLALWDDRTRASADVKALALAHVAELRRRAEAIAGMIATLERLAATCHGDDRPDCPILEDLAAGRPPPR